MNGLRRCRRVCVFCFPGIVASKLPYEDLFPLSLWEQSWTRSVLQWLFSRSVASDALRPHELQQPVDLCLLSPTVSAYSAARSVSVSRLRSTVSHLISTCQPVDQHLSATSFASGPDSDAPTDERKAGAGKRVVFLEPLKDTAAGQNGKVMGGIGGRRRRG